MEIEYNQEITQRLHLAQHYQEINKYEDSKKIYEEILGINPTCEEAYYEISYICYRDGELDVALQYAVEAFQHGYDGVTCKLLISNILIEMEAFEEAKEELESILEQDSMNIEAQISSAKLALKLGENKKAYKIIRYVRELEPFNNHVDIIEFGYFVDEGKPIPKELFQRLWDNEENEETKQIYTFSYYMSIGDVKKAKEIMLELYLRNPSNKDFLEDLKLAETYSHWSLKPLFWINKFGGAFRIWIYTMIIRFICKSLEVYGLENIATGIVLLYLGYILYAQVASRIIVKILERKLK